MLIIDTEENDVRLNGKRAHRVLDLRMLPLEHVAVRKHFEKLDGIKNSSDGPGGVLHRVLCDVVEDGLQIAGCPLGEKVALAGAMSVAGELLAHFGGEGVEFYELAATDLIVGLIDRVNVFVSEFEFFPREHHPLDCCLDCRLDGREMPRLDLLCNVSFELGLCELHLHSLIIP